MISERYGAPSGYVSLERAESAEDDTISIDSAGIAQFEKLMNRAASVYGHRRPPAVVSTTTSRTTSARGPAHTRSPSKTGAPPSPEHRGLAGTAAYRGFEPLTGAPVAPTGVSSSVVTASAPILFTRSTSRAGDRVVADRPALVTSTTTTAVDHERMWLRNRLRELTNEYENKLDEKELLIEKQGQEIKRLRRRIEKECPAINGISLASLKHTNDRLSAQLAKLPLSKLQQYQLSLSAPNVANIIDPAAAGNLSHAQRPQQVVASTESDERVIACEAAIGELVQSLEELERRLSTQSWAAGDEKAQLLAKIDQQQSQFNIERLECDRVVHAMSVKIEELVKENATLRKTNKQQQKQQQQGAAGSPVFKDPQPAAPATPITVVPPTAVVQLTPEAVAPVPAPSPPSAASPLKGPQPMATARSKMPLGGGALRPAVNPSALRGMLLRK